MSGLRDAIMFDAFPDQLRSSIEDVVAIIPPTALSPARVIGRVVTGGEEVRIPYRVYNAEPPPGSVDHLDSEASLILACWYSRHHDGRVRERTATKLLGASESWVVPYVIQLLGEYIVEIAELIETHVDDLLKGAAQSFARENPLFMQLTRERVLSYWAAFYVHRYAFSDYPPLRVMRQLGIWEGREGRHLL